MTVVVSDTSPIRCLAHLQLLECLPKLFGTVLIPPAVAGELSKSVPANAPNAAPSMPFLQVRAPSDVGLVERLRLRLHLGEAEALALAVEIQSDVVLIDEKAGRAAAKQLGLVPLGVLGTLVKAKNAGLVSALTPLIVRLKSELGFHLSADVERRILHLAGE